MKKLVKKLAIRFDLIDIFKLPQEELRFIQENLEQTFYELIWICGDKENNFQRTKLYKEIEENRYSGDIKKYLELYQKFLTSKLFTDEYNWDFNIFDEDGKFSVVGYWNYLMETYPFSYIATDKKQKQLVF